MASASDTTTGIPQQLLDEKEAEEKRKRDLQESLNKNMRVGHSESACLPYKV